MPRKRSLSLTDGEARLMTVLWDQQEATVADIVTALGSVNYSTVQTLLRILETKGYVKHHKAGRAFVYTAVVDQQQARRRALSHLVSRLFDNSPGQLVLNILEHEKMSPDELKRLRKLLDAEGE